MLSVRNYIRHYPEDRDIEFTTPDDYEDDIIAIGGRLSIRTLISAYTHGVYPCYPENEMPIWWSPDPRCVLFPENLHVPRSLKKTLRDREFEFTVDKAFSDVIHGCRDVKRKYPDGGWISALIIERFTELYKLGYAHSVETWKGDSLVGGLYGLSIGGCFIGESMFTTVPDASKAAFVVLTGALIDAGFGLVDCQQDSKHMIRFGAVTIPRPEFNTILKREQGKEFPGINWNHVLKNFPDSTLFDSILDRDNPISDKG